jgi:hypothetical protein
MAKSLEKTTTKQQTAPTAPQDTGSRLKHELMRDKVARMLGQDDAKPIAPGPARVLLALANHRHSPGWERAKVLQRDMYKAAGDMQMKFAFYGEDDEKGVRRCRITSDWIGDADTMDKKMDRAQCSCGCFVNIRTVLQRAVKENVERPMRAVVIDGDAFHDDQEGLDEAALAATASPAWSESGFPKPVGGASLAH